MALHMLTHMTQMDFLHILSCQMLIYDIKTVDSCADTAEIYSDTSVQNVKIVFLHINHVCFFASSNTLFFQPVGSKARL